MIYYLKNKHSFALAEVATAIALVSLFLPFFFSHIQHIACSNRNLSYNIQSQELADEYMAQTVASLIQTVDSFANLEKQLQDREELSSPFVIQTIFDITETEEKKAVLLSIEIRVFPETTTKDSDDSSFASRTLKLCFTSQGTSYE